jgi:hypothetical protein
MMLTPKRTRAREASRFRAYHRNANRRALWE